MTAVIKEQTVKNAKEKEHIQAVAHNFHLRKVITCTGFISRMVIAWGPGFPTILSLLISVRVRIFSQPTDTASYLLTDFAGNVLTSAKDIKSVSREALGQTVKSKSRVTLSCQVLRPGVYIVRILWASEFSLPNHWYSRNFLAVVVLALLLILCVIFGISHWVLTPVKGLTQGMEQIAAGDIEHRIQTSPGTSLEFKKIETEFNHMMEQLKDMQIQIYQQELEQNERKSFAISASRSSLILSSIP